MKFLLSCFYLFFFIILTSYGSEITGSVKSANNEPVTDASVYLEGTTKGSISNNSGDYKISYVTAGRYILIASSLGYKIEKKEIIIKADDKINIDFVLTQTPVFLDEVYVTADKREENLQKVPISLSAITTQKIEDLNIRQRTDLMAISPNTLIAESGSHLTNLINIRGMFPSNFFATTSLFYYDGVPIFGYGQNPMYLNDIERIEIIRGPQGTLYGRNALAGVINIVSKKPGNLSKANIEIGYGNYNDININAGITEALIKDKLFSRISAYYNSKDGYSTNTFLNTNAGGSKGYGGALNLRYFPVENFSAELFGNLEYIDENVWSLAANPATALDNPYKISRNIDSYVKKYNFLSSLKLTYNLSFMDIISTTAYQGISGLDWKYDADFSEKDLIAFSEKTPYNSISEELRFENNKGISNLKWVAGLFYISEKNDYDYDATIDGTRDLINQQLKASGLPFSINSLDQLTKGPNNIEGYAVFGQITYTIFDKLDVTAGLRYEKQSMDINTITAFQYSGSLPNPLPATLKPYLGFLNVADTMKRSDAFDFVSQKYSLSYRFDDLNMVYVSASSGFHGGGYNSGANKVVPIFDPENTWNFELGYKTTLFDNMLRINTDIFFIDWKNQQLLAIGNLSNPLQTIKNAGRTEIKGFELELSAIIIKGLNIDLSFGYLDSKLKEYSFTDQVNGKDTLYDYSGNKLPFSPDINSMISIKYEYPLTILNWKGKIALGVDYQYIGSYYASHLNLFESLPRSLINIKTGWFTDKYDLYLWVKNIADYHYIYGTYEYRGEQQAYLGAPRTFGISLKYKF